MYEMYWEECPLCHRATVLVVKLRFGGAKSCYNPACKYWQTGGEGARDTEITKRWLIPGVIYERHVDTK